MKTPKQSIIVIRKHLIRTKWRYDNIYQDLPKKFNILHDFKLLIRIVVKLYVLGFQIPKDEVLLEHANTKGDASFDLNDKIHPISAKGNFKCFTLHWNINTFQNLAIEINFLLNIDFEIRLRNAKWFG